MDFKSILAGTYFASAGTVGTRADPWPVLGVKVVLEVSFDLSNL